MEQTYFKFLIVLLAIEFVYKGDCLPLRFERSKYMPSKVERMYHGLSATMLFLGATFPKPILGKDDNLNERKDKLKPVLTSLKEMIDIFTKINNLDVIEGSGEAEQDSKELVATKSMLTKSLKDVCEWMKVDLEVEDGFDCTNKDNVHRIVLQATAFFTVTEAEISVLNYTMAKEDSIDTNILTKGCQWVFCNHNPECGNASSKENYTFLIKKTRCFGLHTMSCNECINE